MSIRDSELQEDTIIEAEKKVAEPPMYKVLLHNDDYTTKAFVVEILIAIFNKSVEEATQLMWFVHKNGVGVCGIYSFEVAETKVKQATTLAREYGFPLKATMEED